MKIQFNAFPTFECLSKSVDIEEGWDRNWNEEELELELELDPSCSYIVAIRREQLASK